MKIDFKKVGFAKKSIEVNKDHLQIRGDLARTQQSLVDLRGRICGKEEVECKRCGKKFFIDVDEELFLKLSDGIYKGFDEEADVVEFFKGYIDLDKLIASESESIKADYHICPQCKEGENNGSS